MAERTTVNGIVYLDGEIDIYATETLRTRKALWNRDSRLALEQAKAFATYGELQSAGDTLKDCYFGFVRRYGPVPTA
ncbi:MAG TPA: hypothetical protein VIT65_22370 [Microlunatus sp.]